MQKELTAIIQKEGDGYVSFCPEYDIASQGGTVEEAQNNLHEALELFFETASPQEIFVTVPRGDLHHTDGCGCWLNFVYYRERMSAPFLKNMVFQKSGRREAI
jgi:predicted RNase H-like HicB family nuclease